MNFMILDIGLLVVFVSFISIFLYRNRKKLNKEGLLWLYHTKWGLNLIEKTGKKYKKTLTVLSYLSVSIGYILMAVMVYLFGKLVWIYAFHGDLVRSIKMPPIMPLIPYLPQIFKISWLPSFYFSYWIIILAIVAITHEFFHGIFASLAGVKTKTTGFGFFPFFFPVFLAAFVNLDEKKMVKKGNFEQRAVLSAGTFANILTALLGVILMIGFFVVSFSPDGIVYNDYAYKVVNISEIDSINGIPISQINSFTEFNSTTSNEILVHGEVFPAVKAVDMSSGLIGLYYNSPAIKNNLTGAIVKINDDKINSIEDLTIALEKYSPGETIVLEMYNGSYYNNEIILEENPIEKGKSWIGISFSTQKPTGLLSKLSYFITSYKDTNIYYKPKFVAADFIYDLLWWLVLISFSVALVNMLPVGIFDGGRFFYLTILAITKKENVAEKSFKWITMFFLFLLLVVMIFWAKNLF